MFYVVIAAFAAFIAAEALLLNRAAQKRGRDYRMSEPGRLKFAFEAFLFWMMMALVFFLVAVLAFVEGLPLFSVWPFVASAFWMAVGLGYVRNQIQVSEEGLTSIRVARSDQNILWAQVRHVRVVRKGFQIESSTGAKIGVAFLMMGLPIFAQILLRNVLPEVIDEKASELLRATAAGNLPKPW